MLGRDGVFGVEGFGWVGRWVGGLLVLLVVDYIFFFLLVFGDVWWQIGEFDYLQFFFEDVFLRKYVVYYIFKEKEDVFFT